MNARNLNDKHNELISWVGPLYGNVGHFARFRPDGDEGGDGGDIADVGVADAGVADANTDLLSDGGIINADGSFIPDWQNSDLLPEDLRGNKSFEPITNFSDLVKRTVHAESMVGKQKIALPKSDATPEDIESFWNAIGQVNPDMSRPKTAAEYAVDIPEDMADVFPEERMDIAKEFAHKHGITNGQFKAYMENEMELGRQMVAEQQQRADREHDENVLALKKEWGEAYAERQHVVKRLISEAFGADKTAELNFMQKYAGDPDFVRFAASVGSKMVESKALVAELTQHTPSEAASKIKELETPDYLNMASEMTPDQRTEIREKIREQYQLMDNG